MGLRVCWTVLLDKTLWHEVVPYIIAIAGHGYPYIDMSHAPVEIARNRFGKYLLDSPFDAGLMLDCDHKHPPDIIERLGRHMARDVTKLVVGGCNHRRAPPFEPCAYVVEDGKTFSIGEFGPLTRVDKLGTGSILIHRSVFERLKYPWFVRDWSSGSDQPGEDIYFSQRCREAGIDLWCDTSCCSPHMRTEWVDRWYFAEFLRTTPQADVPVMREDEEDRLLRLHLPGLFHQRRVLYVGADRHRDRHAATWRRWGAELTLLEPFGPNCQHYRDRGVPFHRVVQGDARSVKPADLPHHFDLAFWWHGPEHVTREELAGALANLEAVASLVVCGCPWGEFPQGEVYGNPYEAHRSALDRADFEALGYKTVTHGERNASTSLLLAWKRVEAKGETMQQ